MQVVVGDNSFVVQSRCVCGGGGLGVAFKRVVFSPDVVYTRKRTNPRRSRRSHARNPTFLDLSFEEASDPARGLESPERSAVKSGRGDPVGKVDFIGMTRF